MLGPLTEGLDLRLLEELVGPGVLPPPVARNLLDVADGNPLFIEELVRSMLDNGSLTSDERGWHFERMVSPELPTTIEQILAGRIDRVPGPARAVLAAAAVLGRQFDIDVLTTVCGSDFTVEAALADLEQSRLLLQVRRWPRPEYRFCHPLMAEAAYRRLAGDRRRDLHRRAANAIETLFPDRQAENFAVLAFHYERAGEVESALTCHRRAGDDARAAHALDEALTHYSAAIRLLDRVPSDAASKLRAPLHLGRGYAWWQLADRGAGPELRQALALAEAGGDLTTELEALELLSVVEGLAGGNLGLALDRLDQALEVAGAAGDVAAEVTVRNRITVALANRLDLRRAFESGQAALAAARAAGDERLVARAMDGLKLVAFVLGDFSSLESLTGELETVLRGRNDRRYLQYVLAEGSFASAARGDWDDARRRLGDAQAMNTQLGNRFDSPYILTLRAWFERTQGAYGPALRFAHEAAATAREQENGQWVAWSEANLGAIFLELGVVADALPHLETAKAAAQRGSFHVQLVRATALAAVARLRSGDGTSHVEINAAEGLLRDVTTPDGWTEPVFLYGLDAYLAVATIRAIRGDIGAAEALLEPVLSATERVGWIEGVARTQLALAKCSAGYGAWDRASAALDRALDLTQGELPPVEWRVHAARAQLLAVGGDDHGAEAERRVARSIVLSLAASFEAPETGSRFIAWAMDVVDERALELWP
ncbi:MAG: hypothetical protein M3N68_08595 [Actinomycetota bacterium]|nr:hypothetical protein [Actinomycetota bacterium]